MPGALTLQDVTVIDETATITVSVPASIASDFRRFFDSLVSITGYVQRQVKIAQAVEKVRSEEYKAEQRKSYEKLESIVIYQYDFFMKSEGVKPRVAIKQTRDYINESGHHFTCYQVELIVRAAGRLSKKWGRK